MHRTYRNLQLAQTAKQLLPPRLSRCHLGGILTRDWPCNFFYATLGQYWLRILE